MFYKDSRHESLLSIYFHFNNLLAIKYVLLNFQLNKFADYRRKIYIPLTLLSRYSKTFSLN